MKVSTLLTLSIFSLTSTVQAQGFYKNTDVLELDSTNFNQVVLKSNQTTVVEFYAPWCGHCRNLKKDYTKAAKHLKDIAQVAAINCDYAKNKNICSKYKIEGYPTILGFRPPKINLEKEDPIRYAHATEKYNGPRNTKGIVDFAVGRIKNYVKRIATEEKLNEWLANPKSPRSKVVVFTRRDKLSPLLKSIAIDFLGTVDFAYFPLKAKDENIFKHYDIEQNGDKAVLYYFENKSKGETSPLRHEGSLTKEDINKFLSKFDDTRNTAKEVISRQEYLGKIQRGEKIKKTKKTDHDEL